MNIVPYHPDRREKWLTVALDPSEARAWSLKVKWENVDPTDHCGCGKVGVRTYGLKKGEEPLIVLGRFCSKDCALAYARSNALFD